MKQIYPDLAEVWPDVSHVSYRLPGAGERSVDDADDIARVLHDILINPRFHPRYISANQQGAELRVYFRHYLTH